MRGRIVIAAIAPLAVAALLWASTGIARVDGTSMSPTLADGSTVVFDRFSPPARGDLAVFARPEGWESDGDLLVKRVIAVAGDTVSCCEAGSGRLVVNGTPLSEPYVADERPGGRIRFDITVAEGTVWVMGDNRARSGSHDSRDERDDVRHGTVSAHDLRGVVRVIV